MADKMRKKSEITKQRLKDVGMKLIHEKGYDSTTIRDICESTDVAIGTFYRYFDSKEALFFDLKGGDQSSPLYQKMQELSGDSSYEKLLDFCRYYAWMNVGTKLEELRVFFSFESHEFVKHRIEHEKLRELVEDAQRAGDLDPNVDSMEIVDALFILLRGVTYDWIMMKAGYDLENAILRNCSRMLKAYRPDKESITA